MSAQPKPAIDEHILLRTWLEIANPTRCALEVLRNQLPEVSHRLETSMSDISETFVALSDNIKQYDHDMRELLEKQHKPAQEKQETLIEILHEIKGSVDQGNTQKASKQLEVLSARLNNVKSETETSQAEAESLYKEITAALSSAIVSMQFQDWVTQNLMIMTQVIAETSHQFDQAEKAGNTTLWQESFTKSLLTHFKLGELQQKFVQTLLDEGLIKESSAVGFDMGGAASKEEEDDDIDLF